MLCKLNHSSNNRQYSPRRKKQIRLLKENTNTHRGKTFCPAAIQLLPAKRGNRLAAIHNEGYSYINGVTGIEDFMDLLKRPSRLTR